MGLPASRFIRSGGLQEGDEGSRGHEWGALAPVLWGGRVHFYKIDGAPAFFPCANAERVRNVIAFPLKLTPARSTVRGGASGKRQFGNVESPVRLASAEPNAQVVELVDTQVSEACA